MHRRSRINAINNRTTIHNLEVVEINNEDGLILIKGAVPGSKGTLLIIRDAIKPKSLISKVTKEEIKDESSEKEKKIEPKLTDQEKQKEQKTKEDKK